MKFKESFTPKVDKSKKIFDIGLSSLGKKKKNKTKLLLF
jgi:hypothetical protein